MIILRDIIRKKLAASTLIETIVASIIFMIVFVMAMDAMTRLLAFEGSEADYIVMENDMAKCRKQINSGELQPGSRTYMCGWGEVNVEISNYKGNVYQVDIVAVGHKKRRQISYRYLQSAP